MIDTKHPPAAIANSGILSYLTFNWIQPMILEGRVSTFLLPSSEEPAHNDDPSNTQV